jgi:hypothetical protein
MSMHEFEDVVEESIVLLAGSGLSPTDLRSRYWNLYEFQGRWDTKFTHFRVMEHLLSARYVYRIPVDEHPDYDAYREYFDAIDRFTWVEKPVEREGGYVEPPFVYFDAGSPLWLKMVTLGRLVGTDADPPQSIDLPQIAAEVARLAEAAQDVALIALWYRVLAYEMFMNDPQDLSANPGLRDLRARVRSTRALELENPYRAITDPDAQTLRDEPGLAWWFGLDT